MKKNISDGIIPSITLAVKLGSIAVHAEEMISPTGHGFDKIAMQQLLEDTEVVTWLKAMDKLAMLPKKRTMEDVRLYAKRSQGVESSRD